MLRRATVPLRLIFASRFMRGVLCWSSPNHGSALKLPQSLSIGSIIGVSLAYALRVLQKSVQ